MPKARAKETRAGRAAAKSPPRPASSSSPDSGKKPGRRASVSERARDDLADGLRQAQDRLRSQHDSLRLLHAQMTRARERYRSLFERASVGYLTLSPGGLILEINEAAAKLLGANRAVMRNSPFATWTIPEDRLTFSSHLLESRRTDGTITTELRLVDSAAEPLPVQLVTSRNLDPELGLELRTIIVDLRELKRAQAELQRARDQLEKRVEERTLELRVINDQLAAEVLRRERLEGEVIAVSERERRRFGQDLHDETCQALGGLALTAGLLARRLDKIDPESARLARDLSKGLGGAIEQTRGIARGLHPVTMEGGLRAALEALVNRIEPKMRCDLRCDPELRLPEELALALYRIAQEAITNALKHARASRVVIEVRRTEDSVVLSIADNGVGLPKAAPGPKCMGLDIMGFRARMLGGSCVVENVRGGGTRVVAYLPCYDSKEKVPEK